MSIQEFSAQDHGHVGERPTVRGVIIKPVDNAHRIFLIVDHPVVRDGLRNVLNIQGRYRVVCEAPTPRQALRYLARVQVDCVVMDLVSTRSKPLEVIAGIRLARPELPIVMLSMLDQPGEEQELLAAGAVACLQKREAPQKLISLLGRILAGKGRFQLPEQSKLALLTPRERTVFEALGNGLDKHHIAAELGNGVKTIEAHRESIKHKLGVSSCRELVLLAVQVMSGGEKSSAHRQRSSSLAFV